MPRASTICVSSMWRGDIYWRWGGNCDPDSDLTNYVFFREKNVSRKLWLSHQRKNIYRTIWVLSARKSMPCLKRTRTRIFKSKHYISVPYQEYKNDKVRGPHHDSWGASNKQNVSSIALSKCHLTRKPLFYAKFLMLLGYVFCCLEERLETSSMMWMKTIMTNIRRVEARMRRRIRITLKQRGSVYKENWKVSRCHLACYCCLIKDTYILWWKKRHSTLSAASLVI